MLINTWPAALISHNKIISKRMGRASGLWYIKTRLVKTRRKLKLRFVIKLTSIKNYTSFEALCNKIIYNIIIIKFKNVQSLTNKRGLMNLLL